MDKIFIKKIEELYKNKEFTQIKFEISKLSENEKNNSFILNLLGIVALSESNVKESRKLFERSLFINPQDIHSLLNLSRLSFIDRDHKKIISLLEKYNQNNPNNKSIIENLANLHFSAGNVEETITYHEKLIEMDHYKLKDLTALIFLLNYSNDYSQEKYNKLCKLYERNIKKSKGSIKINKEDHCKLKVGFLSNDLRNHPVGYFMNEFVNELKRRGMQPIAFNLFHNKKNAFTEKLKSNFFDWHDVGFLNDDELSNFIFDKKVYFLIDLAGYNTDNRLNVFKNKIAPIQISWLGYCNSTKLNEIDYIIADPNVITEDDEINYSEKIIRMPKIWNALSPQENVEINDLPALHNKYFKFGSFNNFLKISKKNLNLWKKILQEVPNSLLMLKSLQKVDIGYKDYLLKELNIEEKRLQILNLSEKRISHLKDYNKIDLSLDTFPYNGVTTSFESIWMGVPFLTIKGKRFISRCGYSINKNIDLENFICNDEKEYISKAIAFSSEENYGYLSSLRKSLRKKAIVSSLFDIKSFSEDFCELLKSVT